MRGQKKIIYLVVKRLSPFVTMYNRVNRLIAGWVVGGHAFQLAYSALSGLITHIRYYYSYMYIHLCITILC